MSYFKQALGNAKLAILSLVFALILSFILNVALSIGLASAPNRMTVYVPPAIPDSGLLSSPNQISSSTVYSFAHYIWPAINYWPTNGEYEYPELINKYKSYFTPAFLNVLRADAKSRQAASELDERMRMMVGVDGSGFNPDDVKYIGNGTWLVHIRVRIVETVNDSAIADKKSFAQSHVVKDTIMDYVFRIVRYDIGPSANKYGLAIDGFAIAPKRVQTNV